MSEEASSRSATVRYLPHMLLATAAVTVIPLAAVWTLRETGAVRSRWVCVPIAIGISLVLSALGSFYWKRRKPASELLFSELLAWGFVRRWRSERAIRSTSRQLRDGSAEPEARGRLVGQLGRSLEAHDPYTLGHSRRVARHAEMVARKLGLPDEQTATVKAAAAVHDVGKLGVPESILRKPDKLNEEEFAQVQEHAAVGAALVAGVGDGQLSEIVRSHHERLDGSGYPAHLEGEQIPVGARIIAVVDTFDAITSARPYRPARSHSQAIGVLRQDAGSKFDPAVVEAFMACYAGRRTVAFWAALCALPQTAVAALARAGRPPSQGALSSLRPSPRRGALSSGASVAAISAVALAVPITAHRHAASPAPPAAASAAGGRVLAARVVRSPHRQGVHRTARTTARAARTATSTAAVPIPPAIVQKQLAASRGPRRSAGTPPGGSRRGSRPGSPTPAGSAPPSASWPPLPAAAGPPPITVTAPPPVAAGAPPPTTAAGTPPPAAAPPPPAPPPPPPPPPPTTSSPPPPPPPPDSGGCKDGGYVTGGYPNQGQCVAASHGGGEGNAGGGHGHGHGNG
jgi:hypothetical protein